MGQLLRSCAICMSDTDVLVEPLLGAHPCSSYSFHHQTLMHKPELSLTSLAGQSEVLAGVLGSSGHADGPAAESLFLGPRDLCMCGGNIFVVDQNGRVVRKVALDTGEGGDHHGVTTVVTPGVTHVEA